MKRGTLRTVERTTLCNDQAWLSQAVTARFVENHFTSPFFYRNENNGSLDKLLIFLPAPFKIPLRFFKEAPNPGAQPTMFWCRAMVNCSFTIHTKEERITAANHYSFFLIIIVEQLISQYAFVYICISFLSCTENVIQGWTVCSQFATCIGDMHLKHELLFCNLYKVKLYIYLISVVGWPSSFQTMYYCNASPVAVFSNRTSGSWNAYTKLPLSSETSVSS